MSKYIIDTGNYLFTTDGALIVGFDCDNKPDTCYEPLSDLEELNSDYINEHFGELQDEAYQAGLNDMWDVVRKISLMTSAEAEEVFAGAGSYNRYNLGYSGVEAMDAYKAYLEKKDRIEVGDEVRFLPNDRKGIVTACHVPDVYAENDKYAVFCGTTVEYVLRPHITKTGKHYDIASILEAMKS